MRVDRVPLRLGSVHWHRNLFDTPLTVPSSRLYRVQRFITMAAANGHASSSETKPLNNLFSDLPTTIFTVMTNLAIKHKSINLGQGFPDEEGPEQMKKLVGSATTEHHNQYPPMFGIPELRQAVARHSKAYCDIDIQWDSETLVTVGATEAIASSFLGILNEGEEVMEAGKQACWSLPAHALLVNFRCCR